MADSNRERLVRIETKLSLLLAAHGLDPQTGLTGGKRDPSDSHAGLLGGDSEHTESMPSGSVVRQSE